MAHRNNDAMDSLWGDSEPGNYGFYLDVGLDQNREDLLRAFNKMKSFPHTHSTYGMDYLGVGSQRVG